MSEVVEFYILFTIIPNNHLQWYPQQKSTAKNKKILQNKNTIG